MTDGKVCSSVLLLQPFSLCIRFRWRYLLIIHNFFFLCLLSARAIVSVKSFNLFVFYSFSLSLCTFCLRSFVVSTTATTTTTTTTTIDSGGARHSVWANTSIARRLFPLQLFNLWRNLYWPTLSPLSFAFSVWCLSCRHCRHRRRLFNFSSKLTSL